MKKILFTALLLVTCSAAALADIARPEPSKPQKPSKSITSNMAIRLDSDAKEAVLRIPKSQIKQLRAALDDLDQNGDTAETAVPPAGRFTKTQTIVGGAFMSLAFIFGGMWFIRSGKSSTKGGKAVITILAIAVGVTAAASLVYANAGPPSEARSITGKMFSQAVHIYNYGSGTVRVETKDDLYGIELIVPNPPEKPKTDE